jgi:hypothetical protein
MSTPSLVPREALDLPLGVSAAREAKIKRMRAFLDMVNDDAVLNDLNRTNSAMLDMGNMLCPYPPGPVVCGDDIAQWVVAVLRVHGEAMMTTGLPGRKHSMTYAGWGLSGATCIVHVCPLMEATTIVVQVLLHHGLRVPGSINLTVLMEALAGLTRWLIGRRAASTPFRCDTALVCMIMGNISPMEKCEAGLAAINAARDTLADAMFRVLEWLDICAGATSSDEKTHAWWALQCVKTLHLGVVRLSTSSVRCVRRGLDTANMLAHHTFIDSQRLNLAGHLQWFKDLLDVHERAEVADGVGVEASFGNMKLQ